MWTLCWGDCGTVAGSVLWADTCRTVRSVQWGKLRLITEGKMTSTPAHIINKSAFVFKIASVICDEGGLLFSRPPYNVVCSSCDPAAHRPCHLVLCPPRWGHLVSHMEGTGRTPQLAASPLKHSFCLRVSHWMDHCPSAKRDRDKIFSVSILVMFNQPLRQIYEV